MTMKSTRFFVIERLLSKKLIKGYRKEIYFQVEDVQFFNRYKYSDNLIDVSFYNGNRILIEHNLRLSNRVRAYPPNQLFKHELNIWQKKPLRTSLS